MAAVWALIDKQTVEGCARSGRRNELTRDFSPRGWLRAAGDQAHLLWGGDCNEDGLRMFVDWPFWRRLKLEKSPMADPNDQETQNPGFTDQGKKDRERAAQNPYDKDQASNPERGSCARTSSTHNTTSLCASAAMLGSVAASSAVFFGAGPRAV